MSRRPPQLEIRVAVPADVPQILGLISRAYPGIENYNPGQILGQINNFPEGQFVAVLEGTIVGYCASSRIDEAIALSPHNWATITGNGFGSRHDPTGDWLYGIEMAVDASKRGLRIGSAGRALLESGIRRYGSEDVGRLKFIRQAQSAGFTLDQIGELLELDSGTDRARARQLAADRIEALDARIAELREARDALQRLARECSRTETGPCPIIASFQG